MKIINRAAILLYTILFLLSTFIIALFPSNYEEKPYLSLAGSLVSIIGLILFILGFYRGEKKQLWERISRSRLMLISLCYLFGFSLLWIMLSHSFPVADRDHVSAAAIGFINGDFSALAQGNYLYIYPYQLWYTAFLELCYRLLGNGYYFFPQLVNAIAVMGIFYQMEQLTEEMFDGGKAAVFAMLLSFGGICACFFSTYVYGNILGLFFSIAGFRYLYRFTRGARVRDAVVGCLWIALGSLLKNNFQLFFVMIAFCLLVNLFHEKDKKRRLAQFLVIIGMLLARFLLSNGLELYYEQRSGIQISEGQPMLASLAMGLRDDGVVPGGHTGFDVNIFRESNFDEDETQQKAVDSIRGSLSGMKNDPLYAVRFFAEKAALQWCEPTFQSIWESNCSDNHTMEISSLTENIYYGPLNKILIYIMDLFQSLIWGLSLVTLWMQRKNVTPMKMCLPLIVLAGFIFQLVWEAKSQYNMQYMLIMLPYAARGLEYVLQTINHYMLNRNSLQDNKA